MFSKKSGDECKLLKNINYLLHRSNILFCNAVMRKVQALNEKLFKV